MIDLVLPIRYDVAIFLAAAAAIGFAGVRLARYADVVAQRTGLGGALTGTIVLGFVTALPGLAASVAAALGGEADIAVSNAMGGIAIQTVALAIADVAYRKANLEHAAASAENLMQTALLVLLMTLVLLSLAAPAWVLGFVHPGSLLLFGAAGASFIVAQRTRERPMWHPRRTDQTVREKTSDGDDEEAGLGRVFVSLSVAAVLVLVAGAAVAETAAEIAATTGISGTVAGGLLTAIATSLPEIVTATAAVQRGALSLAVGDIVGGNFFDVLFVSMADFAYTGGSLFHGAGVGTREVFLTGLTILLNVVLLIGLLYRQKSGPARIGVESVALVVLYLGGFAALALFMGGG